MKEELIDDPKDDLSSKAPSGIDKEFRINRYIISYPYKDELLIAEQKSIKLFPFIPVIVLGALGGFFGFLMIHYFKETGTFLNGAVLMCSLFAFSSWSIVIFVLVQHYSKKRRYAFEKHGFEYRGLFGKKMVILREEVTSVFIHKTTIRTNSSSSTQYRYAVCLKVPKYTKDKGVYKMLELDMKDSMKTAFGATDFKINDRAETEARHICEVISEHWKIPVSI